MRLKNVMLTAVVVFPVVFLAGGRGVPGQTTVRTIEFAKLSEYVSDSDKRRNGEKLIVTNVPPIGKLTYERSNKLYFFQPDDNTDVGSTFYTSPALARVLRQYLKIGALTARISCTLVQFFDTFDVYRSPFVTKVEGYDENGKLSWTATGPPPVKLRMPQ
jgi:hypothetical protein